ncbi:MAG: sulfotransferase family 2 domain-containing protein [Alphaproteobacteria bacterium GM7ARS4]|nr:sulfotransferase family 2 domain-containing protein [Alphaproteobacteria bacterium GM7ARS4]
MVIISFKHRFIFIKPTKVAGTSLEVALSRFCGKDDVMSRFREEESNQLRARFYPYPVRNTIELVKHGEKCTSKLVVHGSVHQLRSFLGNDVFRRFLKISVIRNPYDWVVSLYAWRAHKRRCGPSRETSVSLFRRWFLENIEDELYRQERRYATLKHPYDAVDFMIRFEHFEEDLTALSQRLGLTENIYDTFKGIREKGHVRPQSLTTRACFEGFFEGIEMMKKHYAIELERFGYDLPWLPESLSGGLPESLPGGLSGLSVPTETPQEMMRENV